MAGSPDISNYIDLPLVDRDPQDVFDIGISHLQATFPDFVPREGMTEVVLLEAMAEEVAEAVFAINRLPAGMTEVLLSMFDVTRDIGEQPTADVTFYVSGTLGYTVPIGTTMVYDSGDGMDPLTLTTNADLVIAPGDSSGTVAVTGDAYTDLFNGTTEGTNLPLQDQLVFVDYARLASPITGGRDPEQDVDYLTRGVQRFSRLTSTLVSPKSFVAAAEEYPFINRAFAIDNYNPANDLDQNGPVGNDGGYITVAVYGDNETVSSADKATLHDALDKAAQANLIISIIDPVITTVNVSASVAIVEEADPADVVAAITTELSEFLSTDQWKWGNKVRRNDLLSLINNVPGVDYVDSLSSPASDIILNGVANLVTFGTASINVVN